MEETAEKKNKERSKPGSGLGFLKWAMGALIFRLILIYFPKNLNLASRPEFSTPVTSLRRLAEGYWLKQQSMSPYAGSMYHGSPLLLSLLGPLTVERIEGLPDHLLCRESTIWNVAALVYLWNPFSILTCVGFNTTPFENLFALLSLYGACTGVVPVAAFGWVLATHLSLYPSFVIVPIVILLGYGLDAPPRKLCLQNLSSKAAKDFQSGGGTKCVKAQSSSFSLRPVLLFILWASLWASYVLILCSMSLKKCGGILEMFKRY